LANVFENKCTWPRHYKVLISLIIPLIFQLSDQFYILPTMYGFECDHFMLSTNLKQHSVRQYQHKPKYMLTIFFIYLWERYIDGSDFQ